ncbi:uncharacterized protein BP5553_00771 [Venustampulla echinocandica]|uniref:Uncharacterized protein n=1 Tax=Venustampulla echinocandica TaxID=2656787 RepID=A0A370TZ43_9HELO|nr:uncharacterized protein BP5553_00771 [Venustampulla echinocandica]RDL40792.1 hypothetical protein BP5553_00771 [Venustampulla echinocandica]
MIPTRYRNVFFLSILLVIVFLTTYFHGHIRRASTPYIEDIHDKFYPDPDPDPDPPKPIYKHKSQLVLPPVVDNFPLAAAAHSASDLPPIPAWNAPPSDHVPERTPLFIGFTRNWRVLQQCVVSYITAGWPPQDIYIIENTGVMNSNKNGLLSLQNPFFLNHTRLEMLGVNVMITPTLLTFAQLQNFFISTAIQNEWGYYFWSHMDIVALSFENRYDDAVRAGKESPDIAKEPFKWKSLYENCIDTLRRALALPADSETGSPARWGMRFFSYDRLALVNVAAFVDIGAWDTMIPFYMTDCDMHWRLEVSGYSIIEDPVGMIYDVASSLDDLLVLYRKVEANPSGGEVPGVSFTDPNEVEKKLEEMEQSENELEAELNNRSLAVRSVQPRDEASTNNSASTSVVTAWQEDNPFPSPSPLFLNLLHTLDSMVASKHSSKGGRNTWQGRAKGGEGDPFYRDSAGFENAILMTIEHGRRVFAEKWGHRDCDLADVGLKPDDAWLVEHDWRD